MRTSNFTFKPTVHAQARPVRGSVWRWVREIGKFPLKNALARLPIPHSFRAVTFVVRLLALVLAAIWLPLTMHCQLAGLKSCNEPSLCSGNHCGCTDDGDCQSTVCKIIETGKYFSEKPTLSVPAASFDGMLLAEAVDGPHMRMPVASLNASTGAPPGWGRVWQFVRRAAHAPRAPSAVC